MRALAGLVLSRMAADQRWSRSGVSVERPQRASARTNDGDAVKARRILGWPGQRCRLPAVTVACRVEGRSGRSPSAPIRGTEK